uniref:Poly [ADP-ribose] polymerase n=1 Tax=Arcella intermedia TaxID=1963864 RepID=A0A6B2L1J6_9EUKA
MPKLPKLPKQQTEEHSEVSPANVFIPVDELVKLNGAKVYQEWGVTLNQTEVKTNKNKFYKIQVIQAGNSYYCFTRWGRVGEKGRSAFPKCGDLEQAQKMFVSKFSEKTGNDWYKVKNNFNAFKSLSGLYTLIEMKNPSRTAITEAPRRAPNSKTIEKPCTLDTHTQKLVKLIFDNDMFKEQMKKLNIDLTKLPLGELSKKQLDKGFMILDRLEEAIKAGKRSKLEALSNEFYTEIPHSHGRRVLPIIQDPEVVQNKRDMLNILGDIEMAHGLSKHNDSGGVLELDHPLDGFYKLLDCDLEYLDKKKDEFKILNTYFEKTKNRDIQIMDIWKVNRHPEEDRFSVHDKIGNRRLLWHGTNVAVVVAILKTGLRIMPHSGGRVGRGIYFASENGKSANYVGPAGNTAIMFLNEVVLGKEHHIIEDDSSLVQAPDGFHSIIAKGQTEPDPKKDVKMTIDGHEVVVPQGEPIKTEYYETSSFSQTEYLIYKESQCRIRYLLSIQWDK